MSKKTQMDRSIRILGGGILLYLSIFMVPGEIFNGGKLAAISIGLYGLLTGIVNYCPLSLFILQEKRTKREKDTVSKAIKLNDVKTLYFFENFSADEIEKLLSKCALRQYPPEYQIITEGIHKRVFFIIYSGQFKIVKSISDGETKIIGTMSDGETFGERSFFSELPPSVSVFTIDEAKVLEINEENFIEILNNEKEIGIKILSKLMNITCARMTSLHQQIASIGNLVVQSRQHYR